VRLSEAIRVHPFLRSLKRREEKDKGGGGKKDKHFTSHTIFLVGVVRVYQEPDRDQNVGSLSLHYIPLEGIIALHS
jgi:hypothetical protein